jgi:DNA-binding transcriptional LysR family regulator
MDTFKLRYFSCVAETGSLTKASEVLGISHSGISKAISALQHETGLQLFRPRGRGLEITPEGSWLYQRAQEVLKVYDDIMRRPGAEQSKIRMGLSGVIAITCAGAFATEFQESLLMKDIEVGELEGGIVSGELDFGVAFVPSPKSELEYLNLGEVRFSSHARASLVEKTKPVEIPFAVPISEFPLNNMGYRNRDGWPSDLQRLPFYYVSGFAIALNLLRSGKAAVYMPDFVATLENARLPKAEKIQTLSESLAAPTKKKLFLVKRQGDQESRAMKKAAKVVRRICCTRDLTS